METQTVRAPKKKTIRQVDQHSGTLGHFSLDGETFDKLHRIEKYHSSLGTPVSLSVIVRRSIRVYYDFLNHLEGDDKRIAEAHFLLRAAKGT
jgi:hypothetical protein